MPTGPSSGVVACILLVSSRLDCPGMSLAEVCATFLEMSMRSRGVARIFLKGVLSLDSLARPFLQLFRCIVLTSLATLSAFNMET